MRAPRSMPGPRTKTALKPATRSSWRNVGPQAPFSAIIQVELNSARIRRARDAVSRCTESRYSATLDGGTFATAGRSVPRIMSMCFGRHVTAPQAS